MYSLLTLLSYLICSASSSSALHIDNALASVKSFTRSNVCRSFPVRNSVELLVPGHGFGQTSEFAYLDFQQGVNNYSLSASCLILNA